MDDDDEQGPPAAIRRVAIADIYVPRSRRAAETAAVAAIADSMEQVGQICPIKLYTRDDGVPVLVSGLHRILAARRLGWEGIDAIEDADGDPVRVALIELDENLCRNELSPAERAFAMAERKRLYLAMHPDRCHGGDRRSDQAAKLATRSESSGFAADTAAATGLSERAVRRDAERGEKIDPDAMALVRGTRLDRGAYLDSIKRLAPAAQFARVESDLRAGITKAATVDIDADGIPTAEAAPPEPEPVDVPPTPRVMNWGWDDPERLVARACDLIGAERVAEMAWAVMEREAGAAMAPERPVIDEDEPLPDDSEEGDDELEAA